ncbi:MAG: hypothetical protein V1732_03395 [Patescibacteria group bacterium]
MAKKQKVKKMTEEEALKMLDELREKAMSFNGVCPRKLKLIFEEIPQFVAQAKRVGRARSQIYSEGFKEKQVKPFIEELALGLSELTSSYRTLKGTNPYLDVRGDVADFLAREGDWGECMGTFYALDFLFESFPKIKEEGLCLGRPEYYQAIVTALIAGFMMFNSIAPDFQK